MVDKIDIPGTGIQNVDWYEDGEKGEAAVLNRPARDISAVINALIDEVNSLSTYLNADVIYGKEIIAGGFGYAADPYDDSTVVYYDDHYYPVPNDTEKRIVVANSLVTHDESLTSLGDRAWFSTDIPVYAAGDRTGDVTDQRFRYTDIPAGAIKIVLKTGVSTTDDNLHYFRLAVNDKTDPETELLTSPSLQLTESSPGSQTLTVGSTVFNVVHGYSNNVWTTTLTNTSTPFGDPDDISQTGYLRLHYRVDHANSATYVDSLDIDVIIDNSIHP